MLDEPLVALTQVSKAYGEHTVLDAVSLSFESGSTTAVVGASGSGKTTLLQLVNGVVTADGGDLFAFGAPIPKDNLHAFRRRIGYAVQGAGLFPHLTAQDNVTLLARLEGWSAARTLARFQTLLDEVELERDVAQRYPHELSGGQQQRLGLARALMLEPELLLLDEPFSAIDPITRVGIYQQFEKVRSVEQVTTILVTHDMREAVRLADRIAILRDGRMEQWAETDQVVQQPASDYVRNLVAEQL